MLILDYYGYPLAGSQSSLTRNQEMFILIGRPLLDKEIYGEK